MKYIAKFFSLLYSGIKADYIRDVERFKAERAAKRASNRMPRERRSQAD